MDFQCFDHLTCHVLMSPPWVSSLCKSCLEMHESFLCYCTRSIITPSPRKEPPSKPHPRSPCSTCLCCIESKWWTPLQHPRIYWNDLLCGDNTSGRECQSVILSSWLCEWNISCKKWIWLWNHTMCQISQEIFCQTKNIVHIISSGSLKSHLILCKV